MGRGVMTIERKDSEGLPIKFKDIIDVQYRLVRDRMVLRGRWTSISKLNIIRYINSWILASKTRIRSVRFTRGILRKEYALKIDD